MRTLVYALPAEDERYEDIRDQWNEIGLVYNREFPKDKHLVMPTRLGNVIRSFEDYPYRQYRMESITLWPRLSAKINKDYAAAIDDAKIPFDFMINSSVLSAILSLAILFAGLYYGAPLGKLQDPSQWLPPPQLHSWLIEIVIFAVLAYYFYKRSANRATAWGDVVKGAFDLYRWDLLKQLGYRRMPATMTEERALWESIYQQMLYGDQPKVKLAEYVEPTTFANGTPTGANLTTTLNTTRGVSLTSNDERVKIYLRVENADELQRTVKDVVVTDPLPDGFYYEWGSARNGENGDTAPVVGVNPYRFRVGDLKFGETLELTYCATPTIPGKDWERD